MKDEGAEPYPSKRLGQHFLRDQRTIHRIIEALAPKADETIVEIGPGTGALTSELVERAGRLIAIEFDNKLAPLLSERFATPEFQTADGRCVDGGFLCGDPSGAIGKTRSEPSLQHLDSNPAKTDHTARLSRGDGFDATA
jgi:hypothetical protein